MHSRKARVQLNNFLLITHLTHGSRHLLSQQKVAIDMQLSRKGLWRNLLSNSLNTSNEEAIYKIFDGGDSGKESSNVRDRRDTGSIPGSGRFPGGGQNPL